MTIQLYDLVGRDLSRPFSPHCWKIKMALAHKGLEFENVPTTFLEVPKVEDGFGKIVPVIRDGDNIVNDSFDIALYLEKTYPDAPSLFGSDAAIGMARFVETWSLASLYPICAVTAVEEISEMLDADDKAYFVESRQARFNKSLSDVTAGRDHMLETLPDKLKPLAMMLGKQAFIGGETPSFADYIVFGPLQWVRISSQKTMLPDEGPVTDWFNRCLDLYDGLGRSVPAAADV